MRSICCVIGIVLVCLSCKADPIVPPDETPFSCPDSPLIDALSIIPATMPLYLQGQFTTSRPCTGYLRAWKPGSQDTLYAAPTISGTLHEAYLGGLEPETPYVLQAVARDGECFYQGPVTNIVTGAVSTNVPTYTLVSGDSTAFSGWILLNKQTIPGGLLMLNAAGKTVWYQDYSPGYPAFAPIGPHGVVALGGRSKWREIDFGGNITFDIDLPLGAPDAEYHHDL